MTATDIVDEEPTAYGDVEKRAPAAARLHILVGIGLLTIGGAVYALVTAKLAWPTFLGGVDALSYGRLLPVALNLMLVGGLTVGLVGAAYHVVSRDTGTVLAGGPAALGSLALLAGGAVAGSVAVALGGNAGGRLLELPLWADAMVFVGLATAAWVVTNTVRASGDDLGTSLWYMVAATRWAALGYLVGAIPGLDGFAEALQQSFAVTAFAGLWPVAAGLGVAYHVVGTLVPDVRFHQRIGSIAFWSLAFAWLWTASRSLQYGPGPEWLETVAVVFSTALVLALLTLFADFAFALRGRWQAARRSLPIVLVLLGLAFLAVIVLQTLVQSLRGASAVVHFTMWESAYEQLMLLGAPALLLLAAGAAVLGRGRRLAVAVVTSGALIALLARWAAGLQVGYTWIGGVNSAGYENTGEGFRNSVVPIEGLVIGQVAGLAIVVAGLVWFILSRYTPEAVGTAAAEADYPEDPAVDPIPPTRYPLRVVGQGAVGLFIVALIGVMVVPSTEIGTDGSLLADRTRVYAAGSVEQAGRDLYIQEGCWYCHTQQVRAVITDVGLGSVSLAADYAHDDGSVIGLERIGPDLMHIGSRSSEAIMAFQLGSPRAVNAWSNMPGYGHLGASDLAAIASYLDSLE